MEPRASTPPRRLAALGELSARGIPTGVMMAPIIPSLTDHEIESLLEAAAKAGVQEAGYVLLRLPLEIKTLFREWLNEHQPDRAIQRARSPGDQKELQHAEEPAGMAEGTFRSPEHADGQPAHAADR